MDNCKIVFFHESGFPPFSEYLCDGVGFSNQDQPTGFTIQAVQQVNGLRLVQMLPDPADQTG